MCHGERRGDSQEPAAVGYLSYVALGGEIADPFARALLAVAVFQTLLLAARVPQLRRVPFSLSWWAATFPIAALAAALLFTARQHGGESYQWAGIAALALASALVAGLAARSAVAMWRSEICR